LCSPALSEAPANEARGRGMIGPPFKRASAVLARPDLGRDHEPADRATACGGSTPAASPSMTSRSAADTPVEAQPNRSGQARHLISPSPLACDLRLPCSAGRWGRDILQAEGRGFESRQLHERAGQRAPRSPMCTEVSRSPGPLEPLAVPPHPKFAFRGCCRPRRARPSARRGRSGAHRNRRTRPISASVLGALGSWSGRLRCEPGGPTPAGQPVAAIATAVWWLPGGWALIGL
jgi:hypothetical protein